MNINLQFRLVFALIWLIIGTALLLRHRLGLEDLDDIANNLSLVGAFALVFAGWHIVRWYRETLRSTKAPLAPIQREQPRRDAPKEYLPEFDFQTKPTDTPK